MFDFFLKVTNTVWPADIPTNCTACTTLGPVVYVLVLSVLVSSVYVNGLGNSINEYVTG